MGLLNRTKAIENKEKHRKKSGGLLARAMSESGEQEETAGSEFEESTTEQEEIEDSEKETQNGVGLLRRAQAVFEEPRLEGGLLKKASSLTPEKEEEKAPSFTGIPTEKESFEPLEKIYEEKQAPTPPREGPSEEEIPEEKEGAAPSETAARKAEAEPVTERETKTFRDLCEQAVSDADTMRLFELFDDVIRSEGYNSFFREISGVCKRLARGKSVILYLRSDARFSVEYFDPESSEVRQCAKKSFRMQSKLTDLLKDRPVGIRSSSLKDDAVQKETSSFEEIEPWMIIPLGSGERQNGFFLIGNQPKRPRINTDGLMMLAYLTGKVADRYTDERNHTRELGRLEKENASLENLLQLSSLLDEVRGGIKEAFKVLCESLEIKTAALLSGWSDRGRMKVIESIGLSEKILRSYTLSKSDREIKNVVESGEPALLNDTEKRLSRISQQKQEQLKTFIVVPLRFGESVEGILTVHRMKGAGKKLPKAVKDSLAYGAKNLVPFIFQQENAGAQPFNLIEDYVNKCIELARKRKRSLHFILFVLDTSKSKKAGENGEFYFDLVKKTHERIKKEGDVDGMLLKRVDLNKLLFVMNDTTDVEADEFIKKIRHEFGKILTRKKKEGQFTLTSLIGRYPQDTRDPHEILEWIYQGKVF